MGDEWVLDASLIAAALFDEEHSDTARRFLGQIVEALGSPIAPDLMLLEMANIAAKKTWRREASDGDAAAAVESASRMARRPVPTADLAARAYALAAAHRFSAYDAAYLALAEARGCRVATLDAKLARRAEQAGVAHLIHALV